MLKAIELSGFKSFAERTRFEFPTGITVIVGPNGSGKSNVVDAIKWVLGEQSAKSLRGKEMADVIFNGSGARRPQNAAEVTLTLDNSRRLLAVDTAEVQVTRRVYRSGEGEYLINRQPSRLRDIRDLFAGTGVATEAYSVIEQGKVDVLLQSSARDRRLIFEEAAGISRFKAKKVEAARRLERVDQNLLRLSDIVEEVESRLRSVRLQATKARRYREYTTRLEQLRTQLALVDYRRIAAGLATLEAEIAHLADDRGAAQSETERIEAEALGLETDLMRLDEAIRQGESQFAAVREQIAAAESLIESERVRSRELEEESTRQRRQQAALSTRVVDVDQRVGETRSAVDRAATQGASLQTSLASDEARLTALSAAVVAAQSKSETQRNAQLAQMRESAALAQESTALEARRASAIESQRRAAEQIAALTASAEQLAAESSDLAGRQQQSDADLQRLAAALDELQPALAAQKLDHTAQSAALAELRLRRTAVGERAAVLAELEQRLEGLSAGVKQALSEARSNAASPFRDVRGLVADLIDVNVDMAPLVDVALEDRAGHLVVGADRQLFDALAEGRCSLAGRVALVRYDMKSASGWTRPTDYSGQPGVVGRADQFVSVKPEYADLVQRLLGHTWIVESLSTALALSQQASRDARFVTLAGELVTADGLVVVGPRMAATGLVSRRAELRSLREQGVALNRQIADDEAQLATLGQNIADGERQLKALAAEQRLAEQAHSDHTARRRAADDRHAELTARLAQLARDRADAEVDVETAATKLAEMEARRAAIDTALSAAQAELDAGKLHLDALEAERAAVARQATAAKVELAKTEQQLANLREQLRQAELHREERQRAIEECEAQLAACGGRALESQRKILRVTSELATLYLEKERAARIVAVDVDAREGQRIHRGELTARVQRLRARLRIIDDTTHERQLAAGELRHERMQLAERMREDYGVELDELARRAQEPRATDAAPAESSVTSETAEAATIALHAPTGAEDGQSPAEDAPFDRAAVEQEIAELRRKINAIGGVNLDALAELDELESRHALLAGQHRDLADAKKALEQIIDRINSDSRRLFGETLETVRGHFQHLFRKLFGGGQADIVLEEGLDILDAGIEIVARPPGKEPRSISLLSGGEKTLTCVALLLAIFHSRPSPFCVLDEVDAALDEANIERFVAVLREFLTITQFIVVTHSKKTMTAANTLYGITMQESGVSKRVSVRFEDVSETGEISQAAIAREDATQPTENSTDDAGDESASGDDTQAA
jgi:chromosome segregation protein